MSVALRVDLDSAAAKAANQQTQLKSTSTTLNTITIGLIALAVAISVAVAVMTTLIVRRMRVLRARAQRLAVVKSRHVDVDVAPYDAELDTENRGEQPSTEADRDTTSVVNLDLDDSIGSHTASSLGRVGPPAQQA